jgi:taurine dioxygenase
MMELCPITPGLGTEIFGFDLAAHSTEDDIADVRALLLQRGVLVFRDQINLTREAQIAFAARFGPIEIPPAGEAANPQIIRLYHGPDAPPTENIWHSDQSFRTTPPLGSLLRACEIPPVGGDTLFADMRQAWLRLNETLRDILRGLKAEHDVSKHAPENIAAELRATVPAVEQPILRIHPETDQPILYVNMAYTTRVIGLSSSDSAALLDYLFRQTTVPELQCRVRWTPTTCVFWDNRQLQHYAVGDYMPAVRIMERVTIAGDQVRGPDSAGA